MRWSSILLVAFVVLPVAAQKTSKLRKNQFKRVHQNALNLIEGDQLNKAEKYLAECEKNFPEDPENAFWRAVLACAREDAAAAAAAMEEAVAGGLSFSRFVAGPREMLGPLYKTESYRERLASFGALVHGPMVGAVSDRSVSIWLRVAAGTGPVTVRMRPAGSDGAWTSRRAEPAAADDHTVAIEIGSLEPATGYRYEVSGEGIQASGEVRTFPGRGPSKFRIAFGGGAGYVPQNERVWDIVHAQRSDALLLLGDNIYIDAPQSSAMQRYCYYRRQSQPAFRRLVASVPTFAIWDDHDFTTNDKWGGPKIDEPAWKRPVWKVFRQNWANPSYGGGEAQPGCWFSLSIGDVDFFLLDGRYYRTNPKVESPSMLGPVQKRWFLDAVGKSTATFKVLCSPVPWTFVAKGNSKDTWNGFHAERDEIFAFLRERGIRGLVLMSADRHRSDLWRIEREGAYDLWELNSSRLTNQHVHETMAEAEFSYNAKQSFGTVDFDTTAEDPSLTYRIVTIDGEQVFAKTLRLSALGGR